MRIFLCIYLSILLCNVSFTQEKHNYTWLSGRTRDDGPPDGTKIVFTDSSATFTLSEINGGLFGSSVMSDKDGNLLFYSDGCFISNKLHQTMENGDSINTPGWLYQTKCAADPDFVAGYTTSQGVMALPWPGQKDLYLLFHFYDGDDVQQHFQLWYSIVDMGANNGLGRVLEKNKLLYKSDVRLDDGFTAVRHGNGRDWWLFCANDKNTYIRFLLSPKGIEGPFFQEVGGEALREMGIFNQFVFSPDGNWFARTNSIADGGVLLMRFDRCAGRFYQPRYIRSYKAGLFQVAGAAFSHDSRYLYFNTLNELLQYDMDWVSSNNKPVSVGVYDGFIDNFPTNFFRMMLAPDKKIYICAGNGVSSFHVIHRPDLPAPACDFVQRGLPLGSINAIGLNNNPFYQLYNLPESQCDTLGTTPPPGYESAKPWTPEQGISLHPNPANERAYLALAAGYGGRLRVYNPLGQLVYGFDDWQGPQGIELPTAEWPAGMYYIELYYEAFGPRRFVEPLVVVH